MHTRATEVCWRVCHWRRNTLELNFAEDGRFIFAQMEADWTADSGYSSKTPASLPNAELPALHTNGEQAERFSALWYFAAESMTDRCNLDLSTLAARLLLQHRAYWPFAGVHQTLRCVTSVFQTLGGIYPS